VLVANNSYAINWTKRGSSALPNVTLWFDNGTVPSTSSSEAI